MLLSVEEFFTKFPEFQSRIDAAILEALIEQIEIECNSYSGLDSELKQKQAIALRVAFQVEQSSSASLTSNGNVKRIESLNDVIEYGVNSIDPSSYDLNPYGQRLKRFLRSNYTGGFSIR